MSQAEVWFVLDLSYVLAILYSIFRWQQEKYELNNKLQSECKMIYLFENLVVYFIIGVCSV